MNTEQHEIAEGAAWARRLLCRPDTAAAPTDEAARRAAIRRDVEAEMAEWDRELAQKREAEEGRRQAEHVLRHRRTLEARDRARTAEPIGTIRIGPGGSQWRKVS